eukprot:EG_transcript_20222
MGGIAAAMCRGRSALAISTHASSGEKNSQLEGSAFERFHQALAMGEIRHKDALAIYDALEPVTVPFMLGSWAGAAFPTGHHLDGMLASYQWRGKRFDAADAAHPLVFVTPEGQPVTANPLLVMPGVFVVKWLPALNSPATGRLFQYLLPLLTTRQPGATLREVEYRGQRTVAMVYDALPIRDVFHRVDDSTVLAVMDLNGAADPYFFVLRRAPPWEF